MYSFKINLVLLIALLIALFTSCQQTSDYKQSTDNLEANMIQTKADANANILDVTVNEDAAYLVNSNYIIKYDLASGERSIVKSIFGNTAICVDQDSIYTYNQQENTIVKYNMNGEEKKSYSCSFEPIDAVRMKVCENTIIIVAKYINDAGYTESELYQIDLSNGNSSKVSSNFKGNDSYSLVVGLDFIDKNTIMVSSAATTSTMNMVIKGYRFDLKKEKVLEEYILPYSNSFSYDGSKDCFYYSDNDLIKGYNPKTSSKVTLSKLDNTSATIDNENKNLNSEMKRVIDRIFYTKGNLIYYKNVFNTINVIELSSNIESLNILITDNISLYLNIDPLIEQFEREYGCNVHITEYPKDLFVEKIRTKLLAGDSDYDICFIDNPTKDNLLNSILNYNLYEPLDNYDNIMSNFSNMYSGIQSMMSHNGRIFGVPCDFNIMTSMAFNADLKKYGYSIPNKDWSNKDLWKLCDEIIKSGKQNITVFNDLYEIIYFINIYVQEAINQNNLGKDDLKELLTNIKNYHDAGILYDQSNNTNLIQSSLMFFGQFIAHDSIPDYPEYGTIKFPVYCGKIYHTLDGFVMMNKFSRKKELAANFINVMTDEENIYKTSIYRCTLLGSELPKYDIYNDWSSTEITYLSDVPYLLENSSVYTCDFTSLNDFIREDIMNGFYDGSIKVEEAADMIYEKINYTYFE